MIAGPTEQPAVKDPRGARLIILAYDAAMRPDDTTSARGRRRLGERP